MKKTYKIILIIAVIFSAYALPVEINNYINGSLHQNSIHSEEPIRHEMKPNQSIFPP